VKKNVGDLKGAKPPLKKFLKKTPYDGRKRKNRKLS